MSNRTSKLWMNRGEFTITEITHHECATNCELVQRFAAQKWRPGGDAEFEVALQREGQPVAIYKVNDVSVPQFKVRRKQ